MDVPIGRLWVKVVEGRELAIKDLSGTSDPYCVLSIENQSQRQEQKTEVIDKNLNPVWNEEFNFDVYSQKAILQILMWDEDLLSKDDFMGLATIQILPDLEDGETKDLWFKLKQRKSKDKVKGELRLKYQYISTIGMDDLLVGQYLRLSQYVLYDLEFMLAVCDATSERKDDIARLLMNLFFEHDETHVLITSICKHEVANTLSESTLFRTDSMGTKMMAALCRMVGLSYLKSTLSVPISQLIKDAPRMELDPSRLKSPSDAVKNAETLKRISQSFIDTIITSLPLIPGLLREVGFIIRDAVVQKFSDAGRVSTAGFFFLRFLCPSLLNPKKYDVIDELSLNDQTHRGFVLVAKIIQNLANRVQFGGKEAYMIPMNEVILTNQHRLDAFLDSFPSDPKQSQSKPRQYAPEVSKGLPLIIAQDMKIFHRHILSRAVVDRLHSKNVVDLRSISNDVPSLTKVLKQPSDLIDPTIFIRNFSAYKKQLHSKRSSVSKANSRIASNELDEILSKLGNPVRQDPNHPSARVSIPTPTVEKELGYLLSELETSSVIARKKDTSLAMQQGPHSKSMSALPTSSLETVVTENTVQKPPSQPNQTMITTPAHTDNLMNHQSSSADFDSLLDRLEKQSKLSSSDKVHEVVSTQTGPVIVHDKTSLAHYANLPAPPSDDKICLFCGCQVEDSKGFVIAAQRRWHTDHFQCYICSKNLADIVFYEKHNRVFCESHYAEVFCPRCATCEKALVGQYMQVGWQYSWLCPR
eukprot:TRINITY_DN2808_c0_g1_i1.p1 TRINITY_DN2808_c0_g1~~TRINITY_DN2808_c0_g1_i1.p1  ORF type:complete len:755 (+),score=160.37 TRINITY_DN2808_c0_g1_i1:49-2313(+)